LALLFVLSRSNAPVAIGILLVAALTDVADGWFARRFHQETPMGRVLDPITDKAFVATVLLALLVWQSLSPVEALLLAARELCEIPAMILFMRRRRRRSRPIRGANLTGKAATVLQFASVAAVLLGSSYRWPLILATALSGVIAGVSYTRRELAS
jgi:CDP-diacylglycerol--glycerol-3-phosphate 3-phosphatidyltransferase